MQLASQPIVRVCTPTVDCRRLPRQDAATDRWIRGTEQSIGLALRLRYACGTLVCQTSARRGGGTGMFTRIVVPLDGSSEGTIAVPHACLMARVSGATVTLMRVVGHERDVADAQTFVDGLAHEYGTPEVRVETSVREGDAANEILDDVRHG